LRKHTIVYLETTCYSNLLIVAPGVARYCYWKYVRPSKLAFGSYTIKSTEGTHQGDPMSPMLFALGMHVLIKEVREHWTTLFSGVYMDDWDFGGPPEELDRAFSYILKRGPEIGCYLNPGKCCVILLNGTDGRGGGLAPSDAGEAPPGGPVAVPVMLPEPLFASEGMVMKQLRGFA